MELPYDPAVPLWGKYKKESRDSMRYLYTYVNGSIIHGSQKVEVTQVSINGWIDKKYVVCPYNRILFSLKKEVLTHAVMWMNLEDIMLSEISQSQKEKCCIVVLIWGT